MFVRADFLNLTKRPGFLTDDRFIVNPYKFKSSRAMMFLSFNLLRVATASLEPRELLLIKTLAESL